MTRKQTADRVMATLAVLFVLSIVLTAIVGESVWLLLLQAMLEGALVGSVADWFAVKALFDAPLGIRFHTRLVPRNRGKLLRAIADGVEEQVLSRTVIRSCVSETMLVKQILEAVDSYGVARILEGVWDRFRQGEVGERAVQTLLRRERVCSLMRPADEDVSRSISGKLLTMGSRVAKSEAFRAQVEAWLDRLVEEKSDGMLAKLFVAFGAASGAIDTKEASYMVSRKLGARLLRASQENDDVLHLWLTKQVRAAANRLDEMQVMQELTEGSQLKELTLDLTGKILTALCREGKDVFLEEGEKCYRALTSDERFLTETEAKLRWAIYRFVQVRGYLIGEAVERTLDGYSEKELRDFIEAKVGDDLMWIRLNGAVLGGILGLTIFVMLYRCGIVLC